MGQKTSDFVIGQIGEVKTGSAERYITVRILTVRSWSSIQGEVVIRYRLEEISSLKAQALNLRQKLALYVSAANSPFGVMLAVAGYARQDYGFGHRDYTGVGWWVHVRESFSREQV